MENPSFEKLQECISTFWQVARARQTFSQASMGIQIRFAEYLAAQAIPAVGRLRSSGIRVEARWNAALQREEMQATVQASTFLFLFTGQPVLLGRECWFPMAGMPHDGQARGCGSPWAVSAEDIATCNSRANIFTANQQVSLPCEILKLCLLTILSLTRSK